MVAPSVLSEGTCCFEYAEKAAPSVVVATIAKPLEPTIVKGWQITSTALTVAHCVKSANLKESLKALPLRMVLSSGATVEVLCRTSVAKRLTSATKAQIAPPTLLRNPYSAKWSSVGTKLVPGQNQAAKCHRSYTAFTFHCAVKLEPS